MLSFLRFQLFLSLISLLFFGAFIWLLFLFHGPEDAIALGRIPYFEAEGKTYFPVNHVSTHTFNFIRIAYPILLLIFCVVSLRFFPKSLQRLPQKAGNALQHLRRAVQQEISSLSRFQKLLTGLTFLLLVAERIYYLFQFPIHTDEAATYFLFIQNGIWATVSFYPIPNNHLLQNLFASLLTPFFSEPFWILRLPPLFFSLCLASAGFLVIKRLSDFTTAYLASGMFGFGCFTLFLSTQGRGYILLTLLAVMAFWVLFKALQTRKATYWVAFSGCSMLGFYTVPTFFYPFIICVFVGGANILYRRNWPQVPALVLAGLTTLAGTLLLYTPLLLVSGPEALFGNRYLKKLTPDQFYDQLPLYLREGQGFLMGGKFGAGILFFYFTLGGLLVLFLFRNRSFLKTRLPGKSNWLIGFALAASMVVYAALRLQLLLPPPRVLFFKSFFDYLGAALILGLLFKILLKNENFRAAFMAAGLLVFAIYQVLAAEFFLKDYPQPYYTFPALVKQIRENDAQKVFIEEPFYQLFLEYEYARFGRKVQIDNRVTAQPQKYDYIVLEHQKNFPAGIQDSIYREVYKDALVRAFVPKN